MELLIGDQAKEVASWDIDTVVTRRAYVGATLASPHLAKPVSESLVYIRRWNGVLIFDFFNPYAIEMKSSPPAVNVSRGTFPLSCILN